MVASIASIMLTILLVNVTTSLPTRQRYTSFNNFPVVGIKENHGVETLAEDDEEMVDTENINREARQVEFEPNSFTDDVDSVFVEENAYLAPEEREVRAIEPENDEVIYVDDEYDDNFEYYDESIEYEEENERQERDGVRGSRGFNTQPGRNSRQFQQSQQVPQEQNFRQPQPQEQRGGRQTGQIGAALGVLSNPPSAKGDYNFNFSNDDGSSRQESGAPDGIRGSYSFITPEGENVNVSYVADETGFHATGSHIVMPPHVQRMLDHLAKVNGLAKL